MEAQTGFSGTLGNVSLNYPLLDRNILIYDSTIDRWVNAKLQSAIYNNTSGSVTFGTAAKTLDNFDTVVLLSTNFDAQSGIYTVTSVGVYRISCTIDVSVTADTQFRMYAVRNGLGIMAATGCFLALGPTVNDSVCAHYYYQCNVGDQLSIQAIAFSDKGLNGAYQIAIEQII